MVSVGVTVIVVSLPSYIPPQLPLYHFHPAPIPSDPPDNNKVEDEPGHISDGVPVACTAAVELVFIVINVLIQFVVLHVPSPLTQYTVFITGFTPKLLPVPRDVPPHEPENQCHVPPAPNKPPVTSNKVVDPEQTGDGVPWTDVPITELRLTVKYLDLHVVELHVPSARQ